MLKILKTKPGYQVKLRPSINIDLSNFSPKTNTNFFRTNKTLGCIEQKFKHDGTFKKQLF